MKHWILALLLQAPLAGAAVASGYSDFNVGINARNYQNDVRAIEYLSRAIAAPDLPAGLLPVAHLTRAAAYAMQKKNDLAMADYTAALALRPNLYEALLGRYALYAERGDSPHALQDLSALIALKPWQKMPYLARAFLFMSNQNYDSAIADATASLNLEPELQEGYLLRGLLYRQKGDYRHALDDQDKAIELEPKSPFGYFERAKTYQQENTVDRAVRDFRAGLALAPGDTDARLRLAILEWQKGKLDDAATDLAATAGRSDSVYPYIWLAVVRFAAHTSGDELQQNKATLAVAKWPGPIVSYYLGDKTADQVIGAADAPNATTQAQQKCEARFYIGEWQLLHNETETARPLLEQAAATCPVDYVERNAAAAELKRMR